MNVLFICRGKQGNQISPVVQAQANSLNELLKLAIFSIRGKGWKSYITSIFELRKYLKLNDVDLIHAHYSYVGMIASLTSRKPVVVSLMGSDIEDYRIGRFLIHLFFRFFWTAVIVKSQQLKNRIKLKNAYVIPNGVNLSLFKPIPVTEARKKVNFHPEKKYIIFLSDPGRREKNFKLAQDACKLIDQELRAELLAIHNVPHEEIPFYLSVADVLLQTSFFEGSPNAIKEAMACNCPIVSTDVGDVKEVIKDTDACYISTFAPEDIALKLEKAITFGKRTNGRQAVQHLSSEIIAHKLISVYQSVLQNRF